MTAGTTLGRLAVFFAASYALTWWPYVGDRLAPSAYWPGPMFVPGPLLACVLVIYLTGGPQALAAWWRRLKRFSAPGSVYAAAILIPSAIIASSVVLAVAAGAPAPSQDDLGRLWTVVALAPLAVLFGPLFEEPSFRGYGQHELRRTVSPLAASFVIGAGVIVWHVPLFIDGEIPWTIVPLLLLVSVIYAWLYENGGSVWPLVALHTVQNSAGMYLSEIYEGGNTVLWTGFETLAFTAWVALVVWKCGPSLQSRPSVVRDAVPLTAP